MKYAYTLNRFLVNYCKWATLPDLIMKENLGLSSLLAGLLPKV